MAWIALFSAGFCEVFGVFAIKRVTVYQNWTSYLFLVLAYGLSFSLLSLAMTGISMGTAYAVWTGIGTAGSMLLGMIAFGERKEWKRIFFHKPDPRFSCRSSFDFLKGNTHLPIY